MAERPGSYRVGFYPGTFDPVTLGHLDVIDRASALFERLVVGVALSDGKRPLLSLDERLTALRGEVSRLPRHATIEAVGFDTLLVTAARAHGALTLVRGVRSAADFDFECQFASALRRIAPGIETVFLPSSDAHRSTASTFVREIARFGGDISPFVSPEVARLVLSKMTGGAT